MSYINKKNKSTRNFNLEKQVLNSFQTSYQSCQFQTDRPNILNRICKYGNRCNNQSCFRVHSLDEWSVPECNHENCNRRDGTFDRVSKIMHSDKKCKFMHFDETVETYCKRLGLFYMDLPEKRTVESMQLYFDE